jgi:hypothetical protein
MRNQKEMLLITTRVTFEDVLLPSSTSNDNEGLWAKLENALLRVDWTDTLGFGAFVAVILAVAGSIFTFLGKISEISIDVVKRPIERWRTRDSTSKFGKTIEEISAAYNPDQKRKIIFFRLLAEIETLYNQNKLEYRWNGAAAWFFSISQYVIGGLITASPKVRANDFTITVFGFLVLITSLIQKIYDPKSAAQVAKTKANAYQELLNDMTYAIAEIDSNPLGELYSKLSSSIRTKMTEIARIQSIDLPQTPSDTHPAEKSPPTAPSNPVDH